MPKPENPALRLVWMDLEMTGLDPDVEVIVEVATVVTDADLNVIAQGPELVLGAPQELLARMVPVVREMHAKSGLLDAIVQSTLPVEEAEDRTLAFVMEHCPAPRTHPLCGNSIGTDRRFIAKYMKRLDAHLHYRSVDVTSLKVLAERWHPEAHANRPVKAEGHRALADVLESIEELRYWRRTVLR